ETGLAVRAGRIKSIPQHTISASEIKASAFSSIARVFSIFRLYFFIDCRMMENINQLQLYKIILIERDGGIWPFEVSATGHGHGANSNRRSLVDEKIAYTAGAFFLFT